MLEYRIKPIVEWPGEMTPQYKREQSRFDTPWGKTLILLEREIRFLQGKNVIFQCAVRESDIRLDGGFKAKARAAEHPGVIITFDSKHGPLSYYSDLYDEFQDNVRAIALALEALRTVGRYGVNKQDSQYTGYKRLPAAGETTNGRKRILTDEEAAAFIGNCSQPPLDAAPILTNPGFFEIAYKLVAKKLHPDNARERYDEDKWVDLQDAAALLKKRHSL